MDNDFPNIYPPEPPLLGPPLTWPGLPISSKPHVLVVCGIGGREGDSVARAFLKHKNVHVRGLTNLSYVADPDLISKWTARGVEMVEVDYENQEELEAAFMDATIIFGCTDYFEFLDDRRVGVLAEVSKLTSVKSKSRAKIAYDCEVRRGCNIVRAADNTRTLRRFVLSSLPGVRVRSGGRLKGCYHFDAKSRVMRCLRGKDFEDLNQRTLILQPGMYMDDLWKLMRKRKDGTYAIGTFAPGETQIPWTHCNDIGKLACDLCFPPTPSSSLTSHTPATYVLALCTKPFTSQTIACTSSTRSFLEICALIKEIHGIHVSYQQWRIHELEKLWPHAGNMLAEQWFYISEYGYFGEGTIGREDLKSKYGVDVRVTSMEEHLWGQLKYWLPKEEKDKGHEEQVVIEEEEDAGKEKEKHASDEDAMDTEVEVQEVGAQKEKQNGEVTTEKAEKCAEKADVSAETVDVSAEKEMVPAAPDEEWWYDFIQYEEESGDGEAMDESA